MPTLEGDLLVRYAVANGAWAVALAALVITTSVGCGSDATGAPSSTSNATLAGADCLVQSASPSTIDGVFTELPGYTINMVCPSDVDPSLADPGITSQFDDSAAGAVSQNGVVIMRVLAAQLKSGRGDTFVDTFLSDLAAKAAPTRTLAVDTTEIAGQQVRYFNIPVAFDGYAYSNGPTVVIAYLELGTPPATAEDAFTKILANLQ